MAQYQINHKCGHTGYRNITGPTAKRQGLADWIGEQHECDDCKAAAREAARQDEINIANNLIATSGQQIPALKGSDKQIKWAESIRAKFISLQGSLYGAELKNDSASWWINNRHNVLNF